MSSLLSTVIQPGFIDSAEVRRALLVGSVVAVVSAVVGVFTVLRGQSFAGHALADVGTTGGSGAFLVAVPPLWGFVAFSVAGAAVMEMIGIQRARGRDLATGIVLGAALGVAALFLYMNTTRHNTSGAAMTVLFGSIFAISDHTVGTVMILSVVSLAMAIVVFRPLLLIGAHPDLAAAQGVAVRTVGAVYLIALAISVALSAITIGSILSTALLIGPAAAAVRLTRRPLTAMLVAAVVGVLAVWLGVLLAYDSYSWPPKHHAWPVSFFIVAVIVLTYLFTEITLRLRSGQQRVQI